MLLLLQVAGLAFHLNHVCSLVYDWSSEQNEADRKLDRQEAAYESLGLIGDVCNCMGTWLFLEKFKFKSETELVESNIYHRQTWLSYQYTPPNKSRFRKQFDLQNKGVATAVMIVWMLFGVALAFVFEGLGDDALPDYIQPQAWLVPLPTSTIREQLIVCGMLSMWPLASAVSQHRLGMSA